MSDDSNICKKLRLNKKRGQSTIEFAFVSILFLFMLIVTYNAIMAFSIYQYLSYSSFMGARSIQAGSSDPGAQRSSALQTLRNYIPGLPDAGNVNHVLRLGKHDLAMIQSVSIETGEIRPAGLEESSLGVRIEFAVPFVIVPLGRTGNANLFSLDLSTSTDLGREVTVSECVDRMTDILTSLGGNSSMISSMFDQGC